MNYKSAITVVAEILTATLTEEISLHAGVLMDDIRSIDSKAVEVLVISLNKLLGITVSFEAINRCKTLGEVAWLVATLANEQETLRSELSQPDIDDTELGNKEYRVWFGTNRRPTFSEDGELQFSGARDSTIHYGSCQVFVPRSHQLGSLGSSAWKRILTGVDDRLHLLSAQRLAPESYWSQIRDALKSQDIDDRDAIVFIHGYNVSFSEAALRAAQIGYDLAFRGAMTFFSWPSQGSLSGYLADSASIEASEPAIRKFLIDTATLTEARAVHMIVHSMGNRGVLRAVNKIAADAEDVCSVKFEQIILAAADVDVDIFKQLCAAYSQVSKRVTLYVSSKDEAIEISRRMHQYQRIGFAPPVSVIPGFDTVDVANVDMSSLGHGYVAETRGVLSDIHALINHGTEPNRRFGLQEVETSEGGKYWIINA